MVRIWHIDASRAVSDEAYMDVQFGRVAEVQVAAVQKFWNLGFYNAVCEIEGENKSHAYTLTQNGVVTNSWTTEPPEGLRPLVQPIEHNGRLYGHRSTSVGDVMEVGGQFFVVASIGFTEVPDLSPLPA